jgi:molybdopterin-guanine dinucleotide biosynthesis protein A/rhodanese-related sulfurtransferase
MGRNKAFVEIGARPLVLRVVERVRQAGASRVVAVGADDRLSSLLESHGVSTTSDRWPGEGPAGGVITALAASDTDASTVVLVVACDHPDLVPADLALLVLAVQDGAPAAVAVAGGAAHPTVGAWRASTCLDAATHWFAAGGRTMGGLLEAVGGVHVEVDERTAHDVDTPEDLVSGYALGVSDPEEIPVVDVTVLSGLVVDGVRLVDVRQPDEYAEGHVPGAVLIPLADVPERVDEFGGDGPVYVVCRSGGRSASAVTFLRAQGLDAINVAGGTMAWIEAGNAVVSGDSPR